MGFFDRFKVGTQKETEIGEEYVELEADIAKKVKSNVLIKVFLLKEFDDIKQVLDAIREGYTISIINIQPLKETDMMTLKRAIDKIKKTVEANEGDIAGIAENLLIATPSFAKVYRGEKNKTKSTNATEEPNVEEVETYE